MGAATFLLKLAILIAVLFFPMSVAVVLGGELFRAGYHLAALALVAVCVVVNVGWGLFLYRYCWSAFRGFLRPKGWERR